MHILICVQKKNEKIAPIGMCLRRYQGFIRPPNVTYEPQ